MLPFSLRTYPLLVTVNKNEFAPPQLYKLDAAIIGILVATNP